MSSPPYKYPPLDVARQMRADAEADILARLHRLEAETGLDVVHVEVYSVVGVTLRDDDPRRRAASVRIDLAV